MGLDGVIEIEDEKSEDTSLVSQPDGRMASRSGQVRSGQVRSGQARLGQTVAESRGQRAGSRKEAG